MLAAEVNGIRVTTNQKDNAGKAIVYDFLFTSEPKLTYQNVYSNGEVTGQEVVITGKDVKGRFGQDEIILSQGTFETVTFVNVDPSGIKPVPIEDNVIVRITGSHGMEISGLTDGEAVSVYTLDGKQVASAKAMANGYGHWMSDIAGSSSAQKGGAGLPGPILSMLKELSPVASR